MKLWVIVAVGLLIHLVFFFSVFEVFFATPLVTDLTPHKSPLPPPAKRLVFIVADDLQGKEVVFDTVFNESQYTWSWDTPKFLAKVTGGNQDRMFSDKYPGHMKYLAGINAKDMDTWVFDEFQKLFLEAKEDTTLQSKLSNERILFFLHLGGLDHSGYIVRPSSPSYLEHIRFVDDGVQKLVSTMEQHYGSDGKTAYVFTSDHGMTDWAWGLQDIRRTDINQASMAGLLAALVGIPFPKNAVLPMPDNVFDVSDEEMAQMLYANLQQLLAQVQGMREERETRSIKFAFTPFQPLSAGTLEDIKDRISRQLASKQFKEAIQECQQSISLALRGIRYYTTYDRNHLWFDVYRQMLVFSGSLKPLLPYIALTFLGLQAGGIMIQWSASCVAMGVFALIPTGTRELQFNLVVIGGVLAIIVAFYVMRSFANRQLARRKQFLIYGFQILMMALAIFIMRHTAALAANDKRTPLVILAIVEPFLVTTDIRCRLFAVALAWMGPYILLGISYPFFNTLYQ
ncbi:PIGN-like protein [Mya arenaria]|uniref:GPI ethanolamine phosphate transferase 1 n=1 Tax=Mya arenaria TaxID=6604 RepID=A0ABY7E400_MYAAR|nr:PIGN-like protein [Mya arenaria]